MCQRKIQCDIHAFFPFHCLLLHPCFISFSIYCVMFFILALLCATAQQIYYRHVCVRRPSGRCPWNPFSQNPSSRLMLNFGGKVPFHHISRPFLFFENVAFLICYDFFSFSLTWDHMGEKTSNDISSEITSHIHSKKIHAYSITPRREVYQSCSKKCEISNVGFFCIVFYFLSFLDV